MDNFVPRIQYQTHYLDKIVLNKKDKIVLKLFFQYI